MLKKSNSVLIAYLSGPIDGPAVYDIWQKKSKQPYLGTSYLSQFYDLIDREDHSGFVITCLPGRKATSYRKNLKICNIPRDHGASGFWYHLFSAMWVIRSTFLIIAERPKYLIVTDAQDYWFLMLPARLMGIRIIAAYHCTLWPPYQTLKWHQRTLVSLNSLFLKWCAFGIVTASRTISEQVRTIVKNNHITIHEFLPTYEPSQFALINPPLRQNISPINVLFAGRIEANKGIYDFCEMATVLSNRYPRRFNFHICGDGSELANVKAIAMSSFSEKNLLVHGFCTQQKMIDMFSISHIVVVPTRSDFEEGFAMICAEAILAGRPLVTSAACPALALLRPASIEVKVDDVSSYITAIEQLANSEAIYESKRLACKDLQEQFFDCRNSWHMKIRQAMYQTANTKSH